MPHETELAILFADIAGSTRLYEMLGDARARAVVASGIACLTEVTQRHGGTLVKTIGDEVMTTFPTANAAAAAAAEMQETITDAPRIDGQRLAIRVGLHFARALMEEADVFGDAVNVAARMASHAKATQILLTGATLQSMDSPLRGDCRLVDHFEVKGKRDPIEVFELIWRIEDATTIRAVVRPARRPPATAQLVLSLAADHRVISAAQPTLSLGRDANNDLVIAGPMVSRLHARADYRAGKFLLTDQSTNGTFVTTSDGATKFLRRDSLVLTGSGRIGLGASPEDKAAALHYEVVGDAGSA